MKKVLTLDERVARIYSMDLEPIIYKLVHSEDGTSLVLEEADDAARRYRQYLELCLRYPDQIIVPTKQIDLVWHSHILDTGKYRQDCDQVFGYFLDHFPYLGLRGVDDAANLASSFIATNELFIRHFGVNLIDSATRCGNQCGNAKCKYVDMLGATTEARPRITRMAA